MMGKIIINCIKKISTYIGIIIFSLFILPFFLLFLVYRRYSQQKICKERNHRLHNGINILETVKVGGIKQWISVRGENIENPVLLILHGGPGFSMMPYSFLFDGFESSFTIVQWDQRGAGKTHTENMKTCPISSITLAQMHADTLEIVNYLRQRFKKEKLFILSHSWGTVLGLNLAHNHPELIHAYIGAGQFINTRTNEKTGYENVLKVAFEQNNKKAACDLQALNSFHDSNMNITLKELMIVRKWQFKLNKIAIKKSRWITIILKMLTATEYSLLDYFSLIRGTFVLSKSDTLFNEVMNFNMDDKTDFLTRIIIFGGRKDPLTPSIPVHDYFEKINAPYKEYIWFENSGHNMFFEEPEKFIQSLKKAK